MDNVVIYARYSSDKQTEQSIEGQLRYCYQYAEQHDYRVVGEYIDRAISGTSDRRPQFQQMISDAEKKQFKYVLVWKLDRFARNRYDSAIYKTKLKKSGVKVLSVTEGIGDGDESIILEAVLEAMAETYSRQLSQNVKRGMHESALKGLSTGGTVPYGYKLRDGRLVIDEPAAKTSSLSLSNTLQASEKRRSPTLSIQKAAKLRRGATSPLFLWLAFLKTRNISEFIIITARSRSRAAAPP